MEILPRPGDVFLITTTGRAKRLAASQFPIQGRYGLGVQAWKQAHREALAGMAVGKGTQKVTVTISRLLPRTIRLDEAPLQARAARGKSLLELKPGDHVTHLTLAWETARPAGSRAPAAHSETAKKSGGTGKAKSPPAKQAAAVKTTVSHRKPTTTASSIKKSVAKPAHTPVKSSPGIPQKKGTAPAIKKNPATQTKSGGGGKTPPKASSQPVQKTKKPAPSKGRLKNEN